MDSIIEEWRKLLNDFANSVGKDVNKIRECKAALQDIRPDYVDNNAAGRFIRSEDPIIISSPTIIIGNVDSDGVLIGGTPSKILLRGTNIAIEGVGAQDCEGSVVTKATSIQQIAVDPGIDGREEVVMPTSEIVNKAGLVSIESYKDDVFLSESKLTKGISIKSDTAIDIDSSVPLAARIEQLDKLSASLDQIINAVNAAIPSCDADVKGLFADLDTALESADTLKYGGADISSKVGLLDDLRHQCEDATKELSTALREYVEYISMLAEATRKQKAVKKIKDALPKQEDYDKKGSNTSVHLNADKVLLSTNDGDGKKSVSPKSGVKISSRQVDVSSTDEKGALMDGSSFSVNSMSVTFDTNTCSYEDEKKTKGTNKAVGDFNIFSKSVNLLSMDYQFDSGAAKAEDKLKETGVPKDSMLNVRMGKIEASTVDVDGTVDGYIYMNSKAYTLHSVDLDKDGKAQKLSDQGYIQLAANSIYTGVQDDKFKTKKVQLLSEDTLVDSSKSVSINQKDNNNVIVSGDGVSISSKSTLFVGETKVKDKLVATSLEATDSKIANLQVSGALKSNSLNDGIQAPAAPNNDKAQNPSEPENAQELKLSDSKVTVLVKAADKEDNLVILGSDEDKK